MSGSYQQAITVTSGNPFLTSPTVTGGQPGTVPNGGADGVLVLDASGYISGETIGHNLSSAMSVAGLDAVPTLSGTTTIMSASERIYVHYYANFGDMGEGEWFWNETDSAVPDMGSKRCPLDRRTSATNASAGSAAGGVTITGTLPHPLVPGTVTINCGSFTATDTGGGGVLFGTGVVYTQTSATNAVTSYVSTINYTTGVFSCTFTSAVASGTAITASYSYASKAGRWNRFFPHGVTICDFGAQFSLTGSTTPTDISYAWIAADAYCKANNKKLIIPSAPPSHTWYLLQTVLHTCPLVAGEALAVSGGAGTEISFAPSSPVDGMPALISYNGNSYFQVDDLCIVTSDGTLPSPPNLFSSNWLLATNTGTASFSGTTMTITGSSGSGFNIGQQINGPGMANYTTITALGSGTGGNGTYTVSQTQPGVTGSILVTGTNLPKLSAFKNGLTAFMAQSPGRYNRCTSNNCKYGLVLQSAPGHVFSEDCQWNGMFSVYTTVNGGDYYFDKCAFGSSWANMLMSHSILNMQSAGCSFRAVRCHFGFSPYVIETLDNSGNQTPSGIWEFYGCSFESIGDVAFRNLPTNNLLQLYFDMYPNGSFNSRYSPPQGAISTAQTYFFYLPGVLTAVTFGAYIGLTNGGIGFPSGSLGCTYFGSANSNTLGDLDLRGFNGSVIWGTPPITRINPYNPDISGEVLYRREQVIRDELVTRRNLLISPELPGNWVGSSGTTITVTSLTSLASELAGVVLPPQLYRDVDGDVPNVIRITNGSGSAFASLNVAPTLTQSQNEQINLHCWVYSNPGNTGSTSMEIELLTNATAYYGDTGFVPRGTTGAFQELLVQGKTLQQIGGTSLVRLQVGGASATSGQIIYLIAPMVSYGRPAGYNSVQYPAARQGLIIANEDQNVPVVNPSTGAIAPGVFPVASAPGVGSASIYPNGSLHPVAGSTATSSLLFITANGTYQKLF